MLAWARSGKTEELAVAALADYLPRYAEIVLLAGMTAPDGPLAVGTRLARLLEAAWSAFDQTAAAAPAQLRKGPRGGGRDTDQIVAHVRDGETLYASKMGVSLTKAERASLGASAPAQQHIGHQFGIIGHWHMPAAGQQDEMRRR